MTGFLIAIHTIVSLLLIAVVLMQASQGGGLSGTFGGNAASSVLGGQNAGNVLSRITTWLATLFLVLAVIISVLSGPAASELVLPRIFLKQVRTSGIAMANHQSQIAMVEYLENSKIKPIISDSFDLAELASAFQHQIDNKHFGKISITME